MTRETFRLFREAVARIAQAPLADVDCELFVIACTAKFQPLLTDNCERRRAWLRAIQKWGLITMDRHG